MKLKTAILLINAVLFLSLSSCIHWNKKDWNALNNRHFTLNEFYCYSKLDKVKNIYAYIKQFPENKILLELERIFSISINSDEFSSFKNSGSPKDLKVAGFLFDSDFTWSAKTANTNGIYFKCSKAMSEGVAGEGYIYKYELMLKSMGKTRAFFTGEASSREDITPMLLRQLKRKSPMAEANKKPTPEEKENNLEKEINEKAKEKKLKAILKNLSPEERELLKKKLQK